MIESSRGQSGTDTAEQIGVLHDRRRPGRQEVHPSLIPLLRNSAPVASEQSTVGMDAGVIQFPVRDDMGACVGIARGLGVMGVAWVGLAMFALHLAR